MQVQSSIPTLFNFLIIEKFRFPPKKFFNIDSSPCGEIRCIGKQTKNCFFKNCNAKIRPCDHMLAAYTRQGSTAGCYHLLWTVSPIEIWYKSTCLKFWMFSKLINILISKDVSLQMRFICFQTIVSPDSLNIVSVLGSLHQQQQRLGIVMNFSTMLLKTLIK